MARAIPPEGFDEILTWLNPDREVAAEMYVRLRHDLAKLFEWRGLKDPEGLTDEVFDRVARKVHDVRQNYEGDPRLYFRAVANNIVKENQKKSKTLVSLDSIDPPRHELTTNTPDAERVDDCLQLCLAQLSADKKELILGYYAKEKQAKIDHRNELAKSLGIPVETLRVKAHRIRLSLEHCMERCLRIKAQEK